MRNRSHLFDSRWFVATADGDEDDEDEELTPGQLALLQKTLERHRAAAQAKASEVPATASAACPVDPDATDACAHSPKDAHTNAAQLPPSRIPVARSRLTKTAPAATAAHSACFA